MSCQFRDDDFELLTRKLLDAHLKESEKFSHDPKAFPGYNEEWTKFLKTRTKMILSFGADVFSYQFEAEFNEYWPKRFSEIMKERLQDKLRLIKKYWKRKKDHTSVDEILYKVSKKMSYESKAEILSSDPSLDVKDSTLLKKMTEASRSYTQSKMSQLKEFYKKDRRDYPHSSKSSTPSLSSESLSIDSLEDSRTSAESSSKSNSNASSSKKSESRSGSSTSGTAVTHSTSEDSYKRKSRSPHKSKKSYKDKSKHTHSSSSRRHSRFYFKTELAYKTTLFSSDQRSFRSKGNSSTRYLESKRKRSRSSNRRSRSVSRRRNKSRSYSSDEAYCSNKRVKEYKSLTGSPSSQCSSRKSINKRSHSRSRRKKKSRNHKEKFRQRYSASVYRSRSISRSRSVSRNKSRSDFHSRSSSGSTSRSEYERRKSPTSIRSSESNTNYSRSRSRRTLNSRSGSKRHSRSCSDSERNYKFSSKRYSRSSSRSVSEHISSGSVSCKKSKSRSSVSSESSHSSKTYKNCSKSRLASRKNSRSRSSSRQCSISVRSRSLSGPLSEKDEVERKSKVPVNPKSSPVSSKIHEVSPSREENCLKNRSRSRSISQEKSRSFSQPDSTSRVVSTSCASATLVQKASPLSIRDLSFGVSEKLDELNNFLNDIHTNLKIPSQFTSTNDAVNKGDDTPLPKMVSDSKPTFYLPVDEIIQQVKEPNTPFKNVHSSPLKKCDKDFTAYMPTSLKEPCEKIHSGSMLSPSKLKSDQEDFKLSSLNSTSFSLNDLKRFDPEKDRFNLDTLHTDVSKLGWKDSRGLLNKQDLFPYKRNLQEDSSHNPRDGNLYSVQKEVNLSEGNSTANKLSQVSHKTCKLLLDILLQLAPLKKELGILSPLVDSLLNVLKQNIINNPDATFSLSLEYQLALGLILEKVRFIYHSTIERNMPSENHVQIISRIKELLSYVSHFYEVRRPTTVFSLDIEALRNYTHSQPLVDAKKFIHSALLYEGFTYVNSDTIDEIYNVLHNQ